MANPVQSDKTQTGNEQHGKDEAEARDLNKKNPREKGTFQPGDEAFPKNKHPEQVFDPKALQASTGEGPPRQGNKVQE